MKCETQIRSRFRFRRDTIIFISNLFRNDLERPTIKGIIDSYPQTMPLEFGRSFIRSMIFHTTKYGGFGGVHWFSLHVFEFFEVLFSPLAATFPSIIWLLQLIYGEPPHRWSARLPPSMLHSSFNFLLNSTVFPLNYFIFVHKISMPLTNFNFLLFLQPFFSFLVGNTI